MLIIFVFMVRLRSEKKQDLLMRRLFCVHTSEAGLRQQSSTKEENVSRLWFLNRATLFHASVPLPVTPGTESRQVLAISRVRCKESSPQSKLTAPPLLCYSNVHPLESFSHMLNRYVLHLHSYTVSFVENSASAAGCLAYKRL